jgi:hypothetical protein
MARVASLVGLRNQSAVRPRAGWNVRLLLDLLPPALLLGLLRTWATELAPRQGLYFTAEALLLAYAYFAVARSVYVSTHGRTASGAYDWASAQKAGREFHRGLRRFLPRMALILMLVLTVAFGLDWVAAGSGMNYRPSVHLAVLLMGVMVWARYGGAVVLTTVCWKPGERPAFAKARAMMATRALAWSFALTNLAFGAIAVAVLVPFKIGVLVAPNRYDELLWSAGLFTALALTALWLQSRWAAKALALTEAQDSEAAVQLRMAA